MSRYATTLPGDEMTGIDGDARFLGVNAKLAPLLQAGWVAEAENLTFADGNARTREGLCTPASHRWPVEFGVDQVIHGAGVFSDPNGLEWVLIATPLFVFALRNGSTPRAIALPETLSSRVEIVQAFTQVLLFRGSEAVPWVWDGQVDSEFLEIDQSDLDDGTQPIPNGTDKPGMKPALLNDRLWVPHGRTSVAASELLDYARYDATFRDYNLAGGNDDTLTALVPFLGTSLLVFNDQSIQLLTGLTGDLSGATKEPINNRIGCTAPGTVAQMNADVFFLSGAAVHRVTQVIESRLETASVPVSDPIEPLLRRRLTKRYAHLSAAAVLGDFYYLAVPLDGSEVPNAILPYNATTGAWEGVHTFPEGVQLDVLLVADYDGEKALWAVDFANGRVHLMYHQRGSDRVTETVHAIESRLVTRGYLLGSNEQKRYHAAQITVETWAPEITVNVLTDGQEESTELMADWTRSRTGRLVHGLPEIDATNYEGDHATTRRQDYSVACPFYCRGGIRLNREQVQAPLRWNLRERGRYAQLEVSNTAGVCVLTGTQIEGTGADRHTKPAP